MTYKHQFCLVGKFYSVCCIFPTPWASKVLVHIPAADNPGTDLDSSLAWVHNQAGCQGNLAVHTDPQAGRASDWGSDPGLEPCILGDHGIHVALEGLGQCQAVTSGNVGSKAWVWGHFAETYLERTGQICNYRPF